MKKNLSQRTYSQLTNDGASTLRTTSFKASAQLDSRLLFCNVASISKERLIIDGGKLASNELASKFEHLIALRSEGYSVAAIVGQREFFGMEYIVNADVLVPRPETEALVERAIEILNATSGSVAMLDIGTGSGCIAVSCAVAVEGLSVDAIDISAKALSVARQNAAHHRQEDISFYEMDLNDFYSERDFTVISANLPYVPSLDKDESILKEPEVALFSDGDGLSHYRMLSVAILEGRIKGRTLLIEHLPIQFNQILKMFMPLASRVKSVDEFVTEIYLKPKH